MEAHKDPDIIVASNGDVLARYVRQLQVRLVGEMAVVAAVAAIRDRRVAQEFVCTQMHTDERM